VLVAAPVQAGRTHGGVTAHRRAQRWTDDARFADLAMASVVGFKPGSRTNMD
jgi:hypothetical protein